MFNHIRFNRAQFNQGKLENDFSIFVLAFERMNALASAGKDLPYYGVADQFMERVTVQALGSVGLRLRANASEQVRSLVRANADLPLRISIEAAWHGAASAAEDIRVSPKPTELVHTGISAGKNMPLSMCMTDKLWAKARAGKDIRYVISLSDIVDCIIDAATLDTQIMRLDLSIPAGGTLVIDTDNYNVLLNGLNAIHLHRGDWIELDRDTILLRLDSGTGGKLAGTVTVTERYL